MAYRWRQKDRGGLFPTTGLNPGIAWQASLNPGVTTTMFLHSLGTIREGVFIFVSRAQSLSNSSRSPSEVAQAFPHQALNIVTALGHSPSLLTPTFTRSLHFLPESLILRDTVGEGGRGPAHRPHRCGPSR